MLPWIYQAIAIYKVTKYYLFFLTENTSRKNKSDTDREHSPKKIKNKKTSTSFFSTTILMNKATSSSN